MQRKSTKFGGIPWKSHPTPRVPPKGFPGAPGGWGSFLSELRPHAVLLRFIKAFVLLACTRFIIEKPYPFIEFSLKTNANPRFSMDFHWKLLEFHMFSCGVMKMFDWAEKKHLFRIMSSTGHKNMPGILADRSANLIARHVICGVLTYESVF